MKEKTIAKTNKEISASITANSIKENQRKKKINWTPLAIENTKFFKVVIQNDLKRTISPFNVESTFKVRSFA